MSDRFMIAGTGSGCGKTTITCALIAALASLGKSVVSFKCGPDYIDPMFHKKAAGVEARNLDVFLMGEDGVRYSAARHSAGRDVAVIEGVMGLYDGLGSGSYGSSNHISILTDTPVILAVNAKGAALSVCAAIKGFLEFESNNIRGVILNNISEGIFQFYKQMIEERLPDIKVIGFMPNIPEARVESRHLGLVTPDSIADMREKINILREHALKRVDIAALLNIAQAKPVSETQVKPVYEIEQIKKVKIYVARDEAFSFRYKDNHDLLRDFGAEIKFFSPLHDCELPGDADGLILWGGYPELHARELADNAGMKHSIKSAAASGLPIYAECGGFAYLQRSLTDLEGKTYDMLGILPGNVRMTPKLKNFGYYEIEARRDNLLCGKGGRINAHFFRYSESDSEGDCFIAVKPGNKSKSFPCVVSEKNIFAGYQHLHFFGNPEFARNFINACARKML